MALSTGLDWIERSLLVLGTALLSWSGLTMLEQSYFRRLPVPAAPVVAARLPGENPAERLAAASGASAVEPGTWLARLEASSVPLAATVLQGCFPFNFIGNAPQRFIVHAELIQERARQDSQ